MDNKEFKDKFYFVGISISSSSTLESGIAVLGRELNLVRVGKIYELNDLELYINNLAPIQNIMVCVDLPRNMSAASGKWQQESKSVNAFRINKSELSDFEWAERFGNRGVDICNKLISLDIDVFRYYSYFSKNILNLTPPFKSKSPLACKSLQVNIQNILKIQGITSNLIAVSGLNAIIGAYTVWSIANKERNIGYKCIGEYKEIPIITAL